MRTVKIKPEYLAALLSELEEQGFSVKKVERDIPEGEYYLYFEDLEPSIEELDKIVFEIQVPKALFLKSAKYIWMITITDMGKIKATKLEANEK